MGTDEVIRKTLALAQSQLSNYKTIDSHRAQTNASQNSTQRSSLGLGSQTSGTQQNVKQS